MLQSVFKPVFKQEKQMEGARQGREGVNGCRGEGFCLPPASWLSSRAEQEALSPLKPLQLWVSSGRSGGVCPRGAPRGPSSWVQEGCSWQRRVWGEPRAASPAAALAETFSLEQKSRGSQFHGGSRRSPTVGRCGVPGVVCRALTTCCQRWLCTGAMYVCLEGRHVAKRHPLHPGCCICRSLLGLGFGENSFAPGSSF